VKAAELVQRKNSWNQAALEWCHDRKENTDELRNPCSETRTPDCPTEEGRKGGFGE